MSDDRSERPTHAVWARNGNGTVGFIVGGLTRAEAVVVVGNITDLLDPEGGVWTEPEGKAATPANSGQAHPNPSR